MPNDRKISRKLCTRMLLSEPFYLDATNIYRNVKDFKVIKSKFKPHVFMLYLKV